MRSVSVMLVLASVVVLGSTACGGGEERRPARTPASKTRTTSAALTTSTTSTTSASVPTAGTNATMTPAATVPAAPPPRPSVSIASALMRVTTTRCDREEACSNVGTGKEFGDRDSCVNEIGHDFVSTLSSEDCPSGVDSDRLDACLSELKASPCLTGGKADERAPASCSRDSLCTRSF